MRFRWAGGIAVALSLSIAVTTALAAPKAGTWKGTNSQTPAGPLTFRVTKSRTGVLDFQPTFRVSCTKKNASPQTIEITTDAGTNIAIHHNAFKLRSDHSRIHNGKAVYAVGRESISGSFSNQHRASGTYSLAFTFNKSAPSPFPGYRCLTGTLHWTASHT